MYLIENLVKRGLSLQDIFNKIDEEYEYVEARDLKKKILNSFLVEQEILKDDDKLYEVCQLLNNQGMTEAKTRRISQEFNSRTKQLDKGYITNLYYKETINENPGLLAFIFNRIKRIKGFEVTEYNKEYLDIKIKRFTEKIALYNSKLKNKAGIRIIKRIESDIQEKSEKIQQPIPEKPRTEIDDEIDEISNRAKLIKKSLQTKRESVQQYEEIDIDDII